MTTTGPDSLAPRLTDERVVAATLRVAAVACVSVAVIAVVTTAVAVHGTFFGDPTIFLVYAKNLADGHPFSFNPGEFSSGTTSPLWGALLAIPYVLGFAATGAKVFSAVATVAALLTTVWALQRLVGSWLAAAIGSFWVVAAMTFWSVMMYESALVVAAVSASLVFGDAALRRPAKPALTGLGAAWAVTVLARPDAVVLVVCQALALLLAGRRLGTLGVRRLAVTAGLAAIPAALYFGASKIALGAFSVSSAGRSFSLEEYASTASGISYSSQAIDYFRENVVVLVCALLGLALFAGRRSWLRTFGWSAIVGYGVLLTVVVPATNEVERYFTPVAPVIAAGVANLLVRAVRRLTEPASTRRRLQALALGCAAVLATGALAVGLDDPYRLAQSQNDYGYTFQAITERESAEILNRVAPRGARVLTYEVQGRYYGRDDLRYLSLDGLTDAKVAPYLHTSDLTAYLERYRPRYWVANDAVEYRPYLARSPLHDVYTAFKADPTLTRVTVDGVEFRALVRRTSPTPTGSSGWWRIIFELRYLG